MSIALLFGATYGLLFATLLWFGRNNRIANRFLALLLVVIAMRLAPYIIGYAGFFDAYPWLSFLPYNASLAIGPLVWAYVHMLFDDRSANRRTLWPHFLPVVAQLAYYCVVFVQPLPFKNDWNTHWHVPFVVPIEQFATFLSIGLYWWLSFRHYRNYQHWLTQNVSDREDHHVEWVRNFLIALGITLILWLSMVFVNRFVARLDYFQVFPFYLWLTVLAYYLGTEGYRNARHRYPRFEDEPEIDRPAQESEPDRASESLPRSLQTTARTDRARVSESGSLPEPRNWRGIGEQYRAAVLSKEWWRDPELSLASLARKLGTNTSDLSRAINEGLGVNFNEFINRIRVESVKATLLIASPSRSLLDIAFDAGFSSKASFNRSFKLYAGVTPSEFREQRTVDQSQIESGRLKS